MKIVKKNFLASKCDIFILNWAKDFSYILFSESTLEIFLELCMMVGEYKQTKVTIFGTEIGHFYSKVGPKPYTPCSPNPVKGFF